MSVETCRGASPELAQRASPAVGEVSRSDGEVRELALSERLRGPGVRHYCFTPRFHIELSNRSVRCT